MDRPFPAAAVEQMPHPALLVDSEGRIRVWNEPAIAYFGEETRRPIGAPCWTVSRFVRPDGEAWCSRDCPIQKDARDGRLAQCRRLVREVDGGEVRRFDLFTALVPPSRRGRFGVLHLLSPIHGETVLAKASSCRSPRVEGAAGRRTGLDLLSPREREVLRLLASGLDTSAVATRLSISPTTVRNHVQSILRTLGVHSRLDAVLIWIRNHR
jgi:DNA-binding CsgD family transcriptional regulator